MLSYAQYKNVLNNSENGDSVSCILRDMNVWGKAELGVDIADVIFDSEYFVDGGLSVVVKSEDDYKKIGEGYDENINDKLVEKYIDLCNKYPDEAPEDYEECKLSNIGCFSSEAKPRILEDVDTQILEIAKLPYYHRDKGLMRMRVTKSAVYIVFDRELQAWRAQSEGLSFELEARINEIIRRKDPAGVFKDGIKCYYTSIQELRNDYHGKLDYYIAEKEGK